MYLIELTYIKPLAEVEKHLEAHRAFLDKHYAAGAFIASGPKTPRDGGIALARSEGVNIHHIMEEDPFIINNVAEYKVTEFTPLKFQKEFAHFLEN